MFGQQINEGNRQQPSARALERPAGRSDYIGQAYFPYGDYIRITSVGRSAGRITVKGVYTLVSADSATLALQINTNANDEPIESEPKMQIAKGSGNFTLVYPHPASGLPRLTMYSTNADSPFAALYFGTKDEAAKESKLHLVHSQETTFEQDAKESARKWQQIMNMKAAGMIRQSVKSDYIGQTNFPYGDSIEITSVERSTNEMVVRGHYNLANVDRARLELLITPTNTAAEPFEDSQETDIWKGSGDFILIHPHVIPGLPHLDMYSTNGSDPFAQLYFGTREEADEESKLHVTHSQEMAPPLLSYQWMANNTNPSGDSSSSQQEICVNNLRSIDAAKQQWALENKKTGADVPTWADLAPYLIPNSGNSNVPKCPSGGIYTIGPMSNQPTCSIPGHALP